MACPETRSAKNGDVRIAYQVLAQEGGDAPLDLVVVAGLVSHLGLIWEEPTHARFCRDLAGFARVILFDKRGTGLSDRGVAPPDLATRRDDLRAVLDAAGAARPAMLGISEGGMMSLSFAAACPERLRALALYGAFAQSPTRAWPPHQVETRLDLVERCWGAQMMPPSVAPSMAGDQAFRRNWARFEQRSASPQMARALLQLSRDADVSPLLPAIRVPVLLLHRVGDKRVEIDNARYLAAHVPGAELVELAGDDHLPHVGDSTRLIAEIRRFLTTTPIGRGLAA
jgi:pimeloyl-ACP methyl ester carboxylesterase